MGKVSISIFISLEIDGISGLSSVFVYLILDGIFDLGVRRISKWMNIPSW